MWKGCGCGREEVKSGHKIENSFKLVCTNCKCSQWEAYEIHQNWHWHRASMRHITITSRCEANCKYDRNKWTKKKQFLIKIHLSARNLIHYYYRLPIRHRSIVHIVTGSSGCGFHVTWKKTIIYLWQQNYRTIS